MPPVVDPSHPDFPHGKITGYKRGCHATSQCPKSPSCTDRARAAKVRSRDHRDPNWLPTDAKTANVTRRLNETLACANVPQLEARTGLAWDQIEAAMEHPYATMTRDLSEPLDHAWSWFVHGSDTTAEDFPHGKVTSYNRRYCRCLECTNAQSRAQAKSRAGIQVDHSIVFVPGLARHIKTLVAVAGYAPASRAAGVKGGSVLREAAETSRCRRGVARRILAVTPDDCAKQARLLPAARAQHQVHTLRALGYPFIWQGQQPGLTTAKVNYLSAGRAKWVSIETQTALDALCARIGDTPASPEQGVDAREAKRSRSNAHRAGWYPPIHYNDDLTLDYRSIPDHPWAKIDADMDTRIEAVAHFVSGDERTYQVVAAHAGCSSDAVQKWVRAAGVPVVTIPNSGHVVDRTATVAINRVLDVYDAYRNGTLGPVAAAVELGIAPARLDRTHPEYQVWADRDKQPGVAA